MFLTKPRTPRDPDKFPVAQLALLALVRVAEPIALTSIFPYAWKLVKHYHVGSDANAAFYAGILISAFSLAEACSGMYWGAVSDRVGRKPVLLMGCLGTVISLLVVGLAPIFWVALLGRILGGILNGNIGVVQTMVGELVKKPEQEPRAYAVMPFVWSLGTIVGPSIGGVFAEPADNYPRFFSRIGIFANFPYLLPNLICAGLLLVAIIMGYFLLDETHPEMQPGISHNDHERRPSVVETPSLHLQGGNENAPGDINSGSYGTFDQVDIERDEIWRVRSNGDWIDETSNNGDNHDKAITRPVILFVAALGIFTYHSMTYDHLLPIFFQDKRADDISILSSSSSPFAGGLGLSIRDVGIIMTVNGIIALFIQAVVFPLMAKVFGVWKLLVIVTIGHPIAYFIVPYLTLLPSGLLYPGIYTCLLIRNILSIIAFPLLLIMIKEACPSARHLGKINGLAASTGAACRSVASPIAGFLYGRSTEIHFTPLSWWCSSVVAIVGALMIPWLTREARNFTGTVRVSGRGFLGGKEAPRDRVVRITIEDGDVEAGETETAPLLRSSSV